MDPFGCGNRPSASDHPLWRAAGNPLFLLAGVDGHWSLAQTQIACWTVAVGSVVLGYGLIKLEIPTIPSALLVLMGTSLATGGLAFFQDTRNQQSATNVGVAPVRRHLAVSDLVHVFPPGQPPQPSLAKAQMLVWTVILLVLFVSKSIFEGKIWEVPWPLVALMGFSQAGYLAPKLAQQPDTTSAITPNPTTHAAPVKPIQADGRERTAAAPQELQGADGASSGAML